MSIGGISGGGTALNTLSAPGASPTAKAGRSAPGAASSSASTADTTSVTSNANGSTTTVVTDANGGIISSSTTPAPAATRAAPGASLDIQA